ncbi:hypothetical protein ACFLZ7_03985 [Nanoarchaeota archaeon]
MDKKVLQKDELYKSFKRVYKESSSESLVLVCGGKDEVNMIRRYLEQKAAEDGYNLINMYGPRISAPTKRSIESVVERLSKKVAKKANQKRDVVFSSAHNPAEYNAWSDVIKKTKVKTFIFTTTAFDRYERCIDSLHIIDFTPWLFPARMFFKKP